MLEFVSWKFRSGYKAPESTKAILPASPWNSKEKLCAFWPVVICPSIFFFQLVQLRHYFYETLFVMWDKRPHFPHDHEKL